jgi:hypothetical protein
MTRSNDRLGILTALCFLPALHLSAQGTEPTLVNTMTSIANALNSRGTISWTEELPEIFGASYTLTSSLSEVNVDPSECSLRWTSVYTSSDDKLVETYSVRLERISSARVHPLSEYRQSEAVQKVEVSPEMYVVVMKTDAPLERHRDLYHKGKLKKETKLPNDREAGIVFSGEQTADKVSDGI